VIRKIRRGSSPIRQLGRGAALDVSGENRAFLISLCQELDNSELLELILMLNGSEVEDELTTANALERLSIRDSAPWVYRNGCRSLPHA
jgi:hypothetical protein